MATKLAFVLGVGGVLAGCGDNIAPPEPDPPAVAGHLWSDDDHDGVRGGDEAALAGFQVFLDLDEDGALGAAEPSVQTDASGAYTFPVTPGSYVVRQVLPFGWRSELSVAARLRRATGGPLPIIGGTFAGDGEFPFMVAVGAYSGGNVYQFCGGVLVTDRHVVTAGHCSEGATPTQVGVLAGTLDIDDGGQVIRVEAIDVHPDFVDTADGFDMSVWTLRERVDLAASGLYTVEMMSPDTVALTAPDTLASTLGWGASDVPSTSLQQVHVPIVDEATCAAVYTEATNFETQICAGAPEGGVDSCQGDSGGPLLVRDPDRQVWMHAGITSWGFGCAEPGIPGVYARVSALSDWAKTVMTEDAGSIRVEVGVEGAATADFPTIPTTRAMTGAIDPRWQLTALTLPAAIDPDVPVDVSWHLIGDTGITSSEFTCAIDPDGAAALPAVPVACGLGETSVTLPGMPAGIYPADLSVTRAGETVHRRRTVFAGTPVATDTQGTLTSSDPTDPDYGGTFYVDYYEVTGLDGTRAFAVDLASSAFDPYLTLYDADLRDPVEGGGILDIANPGPGGSLRLVVVPEPGRRYSIGVSTYDQADTGDYQVTILNDGVLTPL